MGSRSPPSLAFVSDDGRAGVDPSAQQEKGLEVGLVREGEIEPPAAALARSGPARRGGRGWRRRARRWEGLDMAEQDANILCLNRFICALWSISKR